MTLVVYGDFSCPFSRLASLRLDELTEQLGPLDVRFRAVEHAPDVPVTGRRLSDDARARLGEELGVVRALLLQSEAGAGPLAGGEAAGGAPSLTPNTTAAIAGYAEAVGAGVGDEVRRLLFDAYWTGGQDIGNPEVLRKLLAAPIMRGSSRAWSLAYSGYAVSVARTPITTSAHHRIRQWRNDWRALGNATIPALVPPSDGGRAAGSAGAIFGFDALTRLAEWVASPWDARVLTQ